MPREGDGFILPGSGREPTALPSFLACFSEEHVIFKWARGRLGGDGVGAEEGGGIAPSGADCCWHETELPETSKGVKSVKSNAIYSFMTVEPFVKV